MIVLITKYPPLERLENDVTFLLAPAEDIYNCHAWGAKASGETPALFKFAVPETRMNRL